MKTNYVLIDYENVQPSSIAVLDQENFKVIVFVGSNQAKVKFEVASTLQCMGDKASYIKISGNGPNALDFHIAFYIGQISVNEPDAFFHIISKDVGFDPLIAHLKARKIFCLRSKEVTDIPLLKAVQSKTLPEKQDVIVQNLVQRGASRPRTVKTLSGTINSMFNNSLSEEEIGSIISKLRDKKIILVNGTKEAYSLPT